MSPSPIMLAVSRGLLDHKDRMGPAVWEFLWFVDKVTEDIPDGNGAGKFNGLVLGGQAVSLGQIARDLKEHPDTAKRNVKELECKGYIVRRHLPENRCAYMVTNSKKWFWRDNRKGKNAPAREGENAPANGGVRAEMHPAQGQECTHREGIDAPANKETLQYSTKNNISLSELESSSDVTSAGEGITQKGKKREPQKPSREADRLAQLLKDEILLNAPGFRITPSQLREWSVIADRMIRLDHRQPERIAEIIRWAQANDFWRSNILSMGKLRTRFDQLELKQKANGKSHLSGAELIPRSAYEKTQELIAEEARRQ